MPYYEMSDTTPNKSLDLDLLTWFELNKNAVVSGVVLMVIALAGMIVWKHQSEQAEIAASDSLLLAKLEQEEDMSPDIETLNALADRYSSRPTGAQAKLLAARELFIAGKYSEARERFESLADSPLSDISNVALLGIAACLDAEDKTDESLRAYQKVIDLPDADSVSSQARMSKAQLHEALGQPEAALAIYATMIEGDMTVASSEARIRRADLLRKHPELDAPSSVTNTIEVVAPPVE